MFIVIEGGDGTGKSTLASHLSRLLDAVAYATPPKKYQKYRTQVDREATPQQHYDFYREAVLDASIEIRQMLAEGKKIVCDRYWISTITYHEIMGLSVSRHDFEAICKPVLTVLLTASTDTQVRRMLNRGMSAGDKRMLDQQQEICTRLFQNLVSTESPFISIDTGRFSPAETSKLILCAIS
jgi:thymidylate kinase